MLATPHILVGGAIGKGVKRPSAALLLAFGSHLVLDAVPHVDAVSLLGLGGPKSNLAIAGDALVGAVLLLLLARGQVRTRWILRCALAAIIMDVIVTLPAWFPVAGGWPVLRHLCWLHSAAGGLNPDPGRLIGLATQAPALILPVFLLYRRARPDG
ncbi:MAG TPA: hypothetical protein VMX94_02615 [Armatimonadota bacterium]|nr:hypothetical protein [Armatimonadota bacterium]